MGNNFYQNTLDVYKHDYCGQNKSELVSQQILWKLKLKIKRKNITAAD